MDERANMGPKLDKSYSLPEVMSAEEFEKMPEKAQVVLIESLAATAVVVFRDTHPEYYQSEKNGKALDDYLRERNLPYTVTNLEYAFEDLRENELLEQRPPAEGEVPRSLSACHSA